MEATIMVIVMLIVGGFVIIPLWSLILLYGIRRRQEEQDTQLRHLELTLLKVQAGLNKAAPQSTATGPEPAKATAQPDPNVGLTRPMAAQSSGSGPSPMPDRAGPSTLGSPSPVPAAQPPRPAPPPPVLLDLSKEALAPVVKPSTSSAPKPPPAATAPVREEEVGGFEATAKQILVKIWNWIVVGEEFRKPGVSFESAFASTWLLRFAIIFFVIFVGLFLKYSIAHNWLGPQARVVLSTLAGAGLVLWGLRLLGKQYNIIGQGLIGGGLAMLYFSVFAATSRFGLLNALAGFALMALITVCAGVMAVRFNTIMIAILGIIGGYGTPIMLSTGEKNFVGLYSYLLLLGVGILGIAARRQWLLLNYLGMACTYLLVFGSMDKFYQVDDFSVVLPFFTAFFILYSTTVFIYNLANRKKATVLELLGLFLNAGVFFGGGYRMIDQACGQNWVAVFTLALALFYALHVYAFLFRRINDRGLMLSFIALSAFFLSVTMPVLLSREWLTVSWSLQALVMLWVAGRMQSNFLRHLAYVLYAMVLWRFCLLDLSHQFFSGALPKDLAFSEYLKFLGQHLIMFGVPLASLGGAVWMLRQPPAPSAAAAELSGNDTGEWLQIPLVVQGFVIGLVLLLFVYLHLECNGLFGCLFPPLRLPFLTLLWLGLAGLVLALFRDHSGKAQFPGTVLPFLLMAVLLKLFFFDLPAWDPVFYFLYRGDYSWMEAGMRLLDFGAVIGFFTAMFFLLSGRSPDQRTAGHMAGIAALLLLFVYLTFEIKSCLHTYLPGLQSGGVSILWAAFALSLVFSGLRKNLASLRYAGLLLFAVVIGKVFFSDLAQLEAIYRIIAFLVLGVILLCGSFIYLKYRQKFV